MAAVLVGAIALAVDVMVGVWVERPAVGQTKAELAVACDAAAKSLLFNAITALESAYIDYRTFAIPEEEVEYIDPSIDFRPAGAHLIPFEGEPSSSTTARVEKVVP